MFANAHILIVTKAVTFSNCVEDVTSHRGDTALSVINYTMMSTIVDDCQRFVTTVSTHVVENAPDTSNKSTTDVVHHQDGCDIVMIGAVETAVSKVIATKRVAQVLRELENVFLEKIQFPRKLTVSPTLS